MAAKRVTLDGADTVFFERELQQTLAGFFDPKYTTLIGRSLVGTGELIDEGVNTVRRESYDSKGVAKRIANPADDVPQVQVSASEEFSTMYSYALGFSYADQEIKAGRFAGKLPDQMRMTAVRKALAQTLDEHIAVGDSAVGNLGLLNQTAALDITSDMSAWLNAGTSAADILDDLFAIADSTKSATRDVENVKRIVFPSLLINKLNSTARSTTSDLTILEYFKRNRPSIQIMEWERSNGAGASSKHRVLAYDPAVENVRLLLSVEIAMDAPQRKNFANLVNCYMRDGGVLLSYPKSMCYADVATS